MKGEQYKNEEKDHNIKKKKKIYDMGGMRKIKALWFMVGGGIRIIMRTFLKAPVNIASIPTCLLYIVYKLCL